MASTMLCQNLGSRAVAPLRSRAARRHAVIVRAEQQRTKVVQDAKDAVNQVKSDIKDTLNGDKNPIKEARGALDDYQRTFAPERTAVPGLPENWSQSVPNGGESPTTQTKPEGYGVGEAMSFSGPGPEIINGRLAMLGFVAAVASEFATGQNVADQFWKAPGSVIAVALLFVLASLIPMIRGANLKEETGPFTKKAELWNGRTAMIGIAGLIIQEAYRGGMTVFHMTH